MSSLIHFCVPCLVFLSVAAADEGQVAPDVSNSAFSISMEGGVSVDAAELVDRLVSRDRQFDNIRLTFDRIWIEPVDAYGRAQFSAVNGLRMGLKEEVPDKLSFPLPYDQPHRVEYQMVMRGDRIAVRSSAEKEPIQHPEYSQLTVSGNYWSNADGMEKSFLNLPSGEAVMQLTHNVIAGSELQFTADKAEFACGYGFGKRINSVDRAVQLGDFRIASGRMNFHSSDQHEFRIELDNDSIVRRAEVVLLKEGPVSKIEIRTEGTAYIEEMPPVAKSASIRRTITTPSSDENPPHVSVEFDESYQFLKLERGLSDTEFQEAVTLVVPKGTHIIDDSDPLGKLRQTTTAVPSVQGNWRWYLIVANAAILFIIALASLKMRRT